MCDLNLITVADLAKRIGRPAPYIYEEIKSGRIRAIDFSPEGSQRPTLKIPQDAIEPWLDSLTYNPTDYNSKD